MADVEQPKLGAASALDGVESAAASRKSVDLSTKKSWFSDMLEAARMPEGGLVRCVGREGGGTPRPRAATQCMRRRGRRGGATSRARTFDPTHPPRHARPAARVDGISTRTRSSGAGGGEGTPAPATGPRAFFGQLNGPHRPPPRPADRALPPADQRGSRLAPRRHVRPQRARRQRGLPQLHVHGGRGRAGAAVGHGRARVGRGRGRALLFVVHLVDNVCLPGQAARAGRPARRQAHGSLPPADAVRVWQAAG